MNIFVLSKDPKQAAKWHVDKHIVKMPRETAQILCTVRHQYGDDKAPYKATHKKPSLSTVIPSGFPSLAEIDIKIFFCFIVPSLFKSEQYIFPLLVSVK